MPPHSFAFRYHRESERQRGGEMSVVVGYVILQATSKQQLEVLVKESISKGWQPLGGVAVEQGVFYQAMVGN